MVVKPMRKLIQGIVTFRRRVRPGYRAKFAHLALGQAPDTLFIACSDSRVVPNVFASADPGDLFVIRNVGNLVPPSTGSTTLTASSEAAALEFAVGKLKVSDIIVCGHSECGAMQAILKGRARERAPRLRRWLKFGESSLKPLRQGLAPDHALEPNNQLSQLNVLQQLGHLRSYRIVKVRLRAGKLRIHGWWFDLKHADVYSYEETRKRFVLIDDAEAERLLRRLR